jgi:hypothetical protein
MGVGKYDRCRRHIAQPAKPVRAAINHDAGFLRLNEQCAMAPMETRSGLDPTPRAKERQGDFRSAFSYMARSSDPQIKSALAFQFAHIHTAAHPTRGSVL